MNTKYTIPYTDQELVKKILEGDRHAFNLLIKHTEKLVAQLVSKMIPITADRKDIAQEVYLKIYSNLSKFRFQSKLSTWVGQITYNSCLHHLQKKRPLLLESFVDKGNEEKPVDFVKHSQTDENETEMKLYGKELADTIAIALQQLPLIQQTIVTLFYQEELSLEEISAITSLPVGTLKSYLFRARQKLKAILLNIKKRGEL